MYVIIKYVENKQTGVALPVILLNEKDEIWEFETLEAAEAMRELFERNSDSGHKYTVKKI
jgi:hypothetical protein